MGLANSIGLGVSAVVAPLTGWLVDKWGVKRIYIAGLVMLAISPLVYALAHTWTAIIAGMVLYWLGMRVSGTACGVLCASSLTNEDRATSMNMCNVFGSSLVMVSPMLASLAPSDRDGDATRYGSAASCF